MNEVNGKKADKKKWTELYKSLLKVIPKVQRVLSGIYETPLKGESRECGSHRDWWSND